MAARKLSSGQERMIIGSDSDRIISIIDNSDYLKHIIPELDISVPSYLTTPNIELLVGELEYKIEKDYMLVRADYCSISDEQICFLLYHAFQREFLKNGVYAVHGSAIKRKDKTVLLLGPPKIGKSTISLEMALENDCELYGDDAVKIKVERDMIIEGGNTHVDIRKIHMNNARIREVYPKDMPKYINTNKIGLHAKNPSQLTTVVFLEPDLLGSNKTREVTKEYGSIRFYESITAELRGAGYCLIYESLSLKSWDENNIYSERILKALKKSSIRYLVVAGNLTNMLMDIENCLSEKR